MTALDAAAALVLSLPADRRILIGIAGAPGAGKSTFAGALAGETGGTVLPMAISIRIFRQVLAEQLQQQAFGVGGYRM